jgi:hypothetical protein
MKLSVVASAPTDLGATLGGVASAALVGNGIQHADAPDRVCRA